MVLSTTFNNISVILWYNVVSFNGGGIQSIYRKLLTCRKSLTNFNIQCYIEHTLPDQDSNSQL